MATKENLIKYYTRIPEIFFLDLSFYMCSFVNLYFYGKCLFAIRYNATSLYMNVKNRLFDFQMAIGSYQ